MDETVEETAVTVGQRLREAREAKKLSLEEIAASTRIPTRHLMALENSDWDKLPAATYSIGFAKNYAGAVGLDRAEIGDALREEMGGTRPVYGQVEVFEATDPARTMPKGVVMITLVLLALVVAGLMWVRGRSLEADPVEAANMTEPAADALALPAATDPAATGPVVITANERVWVEVRDGQTILKQGELAVGERVEIPATAVAPVLTTGKPEALQIMVGQQTAPAIGPAGQRVTGVSLKGADLLKATTATPDLPPPPPVPLPQREARPAPRAQQSSTPAATPVTAAPASEPAASGGNGSEQANITE